MTFCFKGRFQIRRHWYNARLRDKRLRWISEESTIEESDSRCFGRANSGTRAENERIVFVVSNFGERQNARERTRTRETRSTKIL